MLVQLCFCELALVLLQILNATQRTNCEENDTPQEEIEPITLTDCVAGSVSYINSCTWIEYDTLYAKR